MTKLWEPWVNSAYGASFDRRTAELIPDANLTLVGARYVVDELIRLIEAKPRA
jgi:hypothetical protein